MNPGTNYTAHRLSILKRFAEEMQRACGKTHGRATYLRCDALQEVLLVGFDPIRTMLRNPIASEDFRFEAVPFLIGFHATDESPLPLRILLHSPRRMFAHPNSDGNGICLGESLPKILPAETLLLHVYRILSFQKYNLTSPIDAAVVRFMIALPPDTFPTDHTPLFR